MHLHQLWLRLLPTVVLLWTSGCAGLADFRRDWRSGCCCLPAEEPAGCWQGCWRSHCTDHSGKLRAIFSRREEGQYCARFQGTFFKVLPFQYNVLLRAEPEGEGRYRLEGQKDLGRLAGGVYRFEGWVTDSEFHASYSSKKDQGIFAMRRRE